MARGAHLFSRLDSILESAFFAILGLLLIAVVLLILWVLFFPTQSSSTNRDFSPPNRSAPAPYADDSDRYALPPLQPSREDRESLVERRVRDLEERLRTFEEQR